MRILCGFLVLFVLLFSSSSFAADKILPVDYTRYDMSSTSSAAILLSDRIVTFGPIYTLDFTPRFSSAQFKRPPDFKGYVWKALQNNDGDVVVVGTHYDGPSITGDDTRQAFIARLDQRTLKVKWREDFKDRVSLDLERTQGGGFVVLTSTRGHYKITLFGPTLKNLGKHEFSASGQLGDLAVKPDGNIVVVGYVWNEERKKEQVAYWEFSSDLKPLKHQVFDKYQKERSNQSAVVRVFSSGEDIYLVNGTSQFKKGGPEGTIWVENLNSSAMWKTPASVPYAYTQHWYLDDEGLSVLSLRPDYIERTTFNSATGATTRALLTRPSEPVQCFPPRRTMSIADVLTDPQGQTLMVISSRPLDHPHAGCTAIGKLPLELKSQPN